MKSDKPKPDSNGSFANGKLLTERLQFEELIVNILEKLVGTPSGKMDKAVAGILDSLCVFFRIKYSGLLDVAPDTRQIRVLKMGCREAPERDISGIDIVPMYPRAYERVVEQEEPIVLLPLEKYPPLDDAFREVWELWKTLNLRILPLKIDGKVTHALGVWSNAKVWKWSPMYTDRLRLLAEIFVRVLGHKRDYDALKHSERILIETQRIASLGSWNWDIATGNLDWSDEVYRIFGLQRQERGLTYQFFLTMVHPDDRSVVEQAVYESLTNPHRNYTIEHRLVRPDGSERTVHERAEITYDSEGKPAHMVGTVLDITERKQSEILLQKALEEVRLHRKQLEAENIYLRDEIGVGKGFANIVGTSEPIQHIMFRVQQVAQMNTTVLLTGETGTGKGVFARALHDSSNRINAPFVQVNCAGLPANLIESELFGRERGAFTGATEKQIGRFELANGGTIFLDEIGELPIELQPKLLRVIESGEFERLGSPRTVKVDVRFIASTNRNLNDHIANGDFRSDLFYRLNVFPIEIPPLRERREDIPLLVKFYVNKFNKRCNKHIADIPRKTMDALQAYQWPGNVRELINVIERAVIVSNGPVLHIADQLELSVFHKFEKIPDKPDKEEEKKMNDLDGVQREHILEVLMKTAWKIEGPGGSAQMLGLKPSTLRARMKKLNITRT
jgi:formate hydrogenlyase transcriptional activator